MKRGSIFAPVILLAVLAPENCEPNGDAIESIGDIGEIALPAAALASAWIQEDREGVAQLFMAFALETGTVLILKEGVDRRRPDGGGSSFPSGHTASAFLGAAFLHRRYGWSYGAPAYVAAVFVGYSRLHAKRHWTTDVIAGAAVGVGANLVFTRRKPTILVLPAADSDAVSCMISIHW